jgi:O-acetyl-ADP-ribose deacetylase (regulator of RNase III)
MTTIQTRHGDMLAVSRGILVHGCNARGRMGKGIAAQIKKQFPAAFEVYEDAYRTQGLKLGTITHAEITRDLHIVNAVTQGNWHHPDPTFLLADYDAIERAFRLVREMAHAKSLPVHFPLIGCGLAHGDWNEVAPRIERALGPDIEKLLWLLPQGTRRT